MKKQNSSPEPAQIRSRDLLNSVFLGLLLGACSGLGPTDFISPGALNPTESSSSMGGFADTDEDGTSPENEASVTDDATGFAEVMVDGYTHEIATTSETVRVGEDTYAIPQEGQNQGAGFDAVVALDSESILSGESPFGFSSATETNEDGPQSYDGEEFPAIPLSEAEDLAGDVASEQNQNTLTNPANQTNQASAEEEESLSETELGDEILVAQLPVPPAKEDEESCDPNQPTESVALPLQSAGAQEPPVVPEPTKAKQTVFLVPADLVGPCSEIEIEALPPALRTIRNSLVINQAKTTKNVNTNIRFLDYPCEDEGDLIPVVCRVDSEQETPDVSQYVWQILPKTTNVPGKTTPDFSAPKTPTASDTPLPRIRPSIKDSGNSEAPQKSPAAPTTRDPVSKATAPKPEPKPKIPVTVPLQPAPDSNVVKTKTPMAEDNTVYIDLSSTDSFVIPAAPVSKTPAKKPAKTTPAAKRAY